MELRLYEYAVILQPKLDSDDEVIEEGKVLVEPTSILAEDPSEVQITAARAIPEQYSKDLKRITLVVRPF